MSFKGSIFQFSLNLPLKTEFAPRSGILCPEGHFGVGHPVQEFFIKLRIQNEEKYKYSVLLLYDGFLKEMSTLRNKLNIQNNIKVPRILFSF